MNKQQRNNGVNNPIRVVFAVLNNSTVNMAATSAGSRPTHYVTWKYSYKSLNNP